VAPEEPGFRARTHPVLNDNVTVYAGVKYPVQDSCCENIIRKYFPHSENDLFEVRIMEPFSYRSATSWKNRWEAVSVILRYPISSTIRGAGCVYIRSLGLIVPLAYASSSVSTKSCAVT
jgi:hypothetical protein